MGKWTYFSAPFLPTSSFLNYTHLTSSSSGMVTALASAYSPKKTKNRELCDKKKTLKIIFKQQTPSYADPLSYRLIYYSLGENFRLVISLSSVLALYKKSQPYGSFIIIIGEGLKIGTMVNICPAPCIEFDLNLRSFKH